MADVENADVISLSLAFFPYLRSVEICPAKRKKFPPYAATSGWEATCFPKFFFAFVLHVRKQGSGKEPETALNKRKISGVLQLTGSLVKTSSHPVAAKEQKHKPWKEKENLPGLHMSDARSRAHHHEAKNITIGAFRTEAT